MQIENPMEGSRKSSASEPLCRVSYPAKPHKLFRRSDPPLSMCFGCKGQRYLEHKRYYYYCSTCDLEFHRGCHFFTPEIKHPFHLLHPLTLTFSSPYFKISCIHAGWDSSSSDSERENDYSRAPEHERDENREKCKSCRRNLDGEPYYHCSVCNFSLHFHCARNQPPLNIENLKTHEHTLTLFPRLVPLPCDACGFSLDATFDPVYSCLLCNYMVHSTCIYLPRVIKITRHPHRLSFTSSVVPSSELTCGVCRKIVDVNYGQYSCKKGCHYAVHSKCATKDEVWDGKDLEGVPEEEEEDIEPFLRIDKETILHFCHHRHYLKIHGNENHENKFCQACTLPITVSDRFYSCIVDQCDFVLHETCASLPCKNYHPLHKHPLTLFNPSSPSPDKLLLEYRSNGGFECDGCYRVCCGFVYKCCEKDCVFQLDVRCASLPDPTIHDCHPHDHPLFFNLTQGRCMGCKSNCSLKYLECIECNSFLGLKCATLPRVAHYKHDKHPLTLCYGEEAATDVKYWCEICETKLDATKWFYTCNSCSVTLHLKCLLGNDVSYFKPNHIIKIFGEYVDIARNNGNSRPVCGECRRRCPETLVFKWQDRDFCSLNCCLFKINDYKDQDMLHDT